MLKLKLFFQALKACSEIEAKANGGGRATESIWLRLASDAALLQPAGSGAAPLHLAQNLHVGAVPASLLLVCARKALTQQQHQQQQQFDQRSNADSSDEAACFLLGRSSSVDGERLSRAAYLVSQIDNGALKAAFVLQHYESFSFEDNVRLFGDLGGGNDDGVAEWAAALDADSIGELRTLQRRFALLSSLRRDFGALLGNADSSDERGDNALTLNERSVYRFLYERHYVAMETERGTAMPALSLATVLGSVRARKQLLRCVAGAPPLRTWQACLDNFRKQKTASLPLLWALLFVTRNHACAIELALNLNLNVIILVFFLKKKRKLDFILFQS